MQPAEQQYGSCIFHQNAPFPKFLLPVRRGSHDNLPSPGKQERIKAGSGMSALVIVNPGHVCMQG